MFDARQRTFLSPFRRSRDLDQGEPSPQVPLAALIYRNRGDRWPDARVLI
jgi:hypothetical protein